MKLSDAKIRTPKTTNTNVENPVFLRSNILTDNLRGEFLKVPITNLRPYKNQARKIFEDSEIKSLADTIKTHGIRQPLTVTLIPERPGFYEVVSGERRLRAAELLGLERVPCIILENEKSSEEVALIENIQRKDLHPIELANAISNLFETGKYHSHDAMASSLGLSRSKITELLTISDLPEEIKETLLKIGHVSRGLLRDILSKNSIEEMSFLLNSKDIEPHSIEASIPKKVNRSQKPVLLRISSGKGGLEMFTSKLYLLDSDKKEKLRELLQEFIKAL